MASDPPNTPAGQEQQEFDGEEGHHPHGHHSGRASVGEILSQPETQSELKVLGGLYALLGVGFGLLMLVLDSMVLEETAGADLLSSVIAAVLFGLLVFIGPVIAALTSFDLSNRFANRPRHAWVTSAVGNGVGFIIMVVVTVLFVNSVFTGSGGDLFNLSDLLVPLVALAIPTAVVGVGAAYLYDRFGDTRRVDA